MRSDSGGGAVNEPHNFYCFFLFATKHAYEWINKYEWTEEGSIERFFLLKNLKTIMHD